MTPRPKPEQWDCGVAQPGEWSQALGCWFGELLKSDQLYSLYFQLEHEPGLADGLWIARRDEEIDAVAWIIPGAARFAHCWPIRCQIDLPDHLKQVVAKQLWKVVSAEYQNRGTTFFQVNVPVQFEVDRKQMLAVGFKEIARIQRLRLALDRPVIEDQDKLVQIEPFHTGQDVAFNQLMIESMADSLDVPELNNFQSVEEVAAQYHKPGVERFFLRHTNHGIVGVMAIQHDSEVGFIRYLGLVSSGRRQGWGSSALRQAITYLHLQGCDAVELRVDARNEPALYLYQGTGFQIVEEESMMIFV
jgi:GNAT superfamily N-acetyltransferase